MLPEGFEWRDRYRYAQGELALFSGGRQVATLMPRGAGAWSARLWSHWPIDTPLVLRDWSSFETGKTGLEAWVARHQAQIREGVTTGVIRRPAGE